MPNPQGVDQDRLNKYIALPSMGLHDRSCVRCSDIASEDDLSLYNETSSHSANECTFENLAKRAEKPGDLDPENILAKSCNTIPSIISKNQSKRVDDQWGISKSLSPLVDDGG